MTNDKKNTGFIERLKFIIGYTGDTNKAFAEKCGITEKQIYKYLNGSSQPGTPVYVELQKQYPDVNINWLITGGGSPYITMVYPKGANVPEPPDEPDLENFKAVIRNFMDKPFAAEIAMNLVELEYNSPEAYKKVASYIKGVVDGIKMMSQAAKPPERVERRKEERRSGDPSEPTEGIDRRSSQDRRNTGTVR